MQFKNLALAAATTVVLSSTAAASDSNGRTSSGNLRAAAATNGIATSPASASEAPAAGAGGNSGGRHLMEGMLDHFVPLPCNANLAVADCDGTTLLSSILSETAAANAATNATLAAVVPCGTCAIADLSDGATLDAPTGIDVQGMLHFPSDAHGTLTVAHVIVQGVLKIDPPIPTTNGRVKVRLTGTDENVLLAPHPHNAAACGGGTCSLGKRPVAVAGGRLDVRGVDYDEVDGDACPSWVHLRDLWALPVPPSPFAQVRAVDYDSMNGVDGIGRNTVGSFDGGDYVTYHNIDFGSPDTVQATAIKVRYSKGGGSAGAVIECRAGSATGTLLFAYTPKDTGGWGDFIEDTVALDVLPEGSSTVTFVVRNDVGAWTFDWFQPVTDDQKVVTVLAVGTAAAECWNSTAPGGQVLVTDSARRRENAWTPAYNQKVTTVLSADPVAGTVTVDANVFDFKDPSTLENEPTMAAEVASLNRPVVFESVADGSGDWHGGHLIVYHTPNVAQRLEGVLVDGFGQQGILGRYPVHFHMSNNVAGSVVRKNVIRRSKQRCIVVHGSHAVLVENNVAYDTFGHCYITEDGTEVDNEFVGNLGAYTRKQSNVRTIGASDEEASTFWITNPRNHFIGNVAAGSTQNGFWFEIPPSLRTEPLYTFRDNVSHSNGMFGMTVYPNTWQPSATAHLDNCKMYNNRSGLKLKRSRNIKVRNALFANNLVSLEAGNNVGSNTIETSTFHCVPPRFADTQCPDGESGITFSHEKSYIRIRVKSSSFIGYSNPGCGEKGLALQLENLKNNANAGSTMVTADFEGLTFDPPRATFGIKPNSYFDAHTVFLEDAEGSMTTSGLPGFFVHNVAYNAAMFLQGPSCYSNGGKYSDESLFCEDACLRTVHIETHADSLTMLIVTSRADPSKSFLYESGSSGASDPAYNLQFDIGLVPQDEYDLTFVDQMDNTMFLSSTINLGGAPACTGHVTNDNFQFPPISSGTFHLYKRTNATDLAAQSGLVVNEQSVGSFDDGDWVSYSSVWFGAAADTTPFGAVADTTRVKVRFSAGGGGGRVDARLGGLYGEVIGTFQPWNTGLGNYVDAAFDIDGNVEGLHQLTFAGLDSSDIMSLEWFELAPQCSSYGFICLDDSDCCSSICSNDGYCEKLPPSTYYIGYENRGCDGKNELGAFYDMPTVEDCAAACDADSSCVSFEWKKAATTCHLSTTCAPFSITTVSSTSNWNWYVKVPNGVNVDGNPEGDAYLWLLDNAAEVSSPVEFAMTNSIDLPMASYYIGYSTGGCIGRNELGTSSQLTVEDCASACDAEPSCVSFEYERSNTDCIRSTSCDAFSLTVNSPGNDYMWYQKAPGGHITHTIQGGSAFLWLINVLVPTTSPSTASSISVSPSTSLSPTASLKATYYIGHKNRGCSGRNELGAFTKSTVEDCAAACDADSSCVSFEWKKATTKCHLSTTCALFSITTAGSSGDWNWYMKVPNGVDAGSNPEGDAYLWLLDNEGEVSVPLELTTASYYVGYNTGGCVGRNELGGDYKPTIEDCASWCDAEPSCVSFEYKKTSTYCIRSTSCDAFSLTVNNPGNTYMWYQKAPGGYTTHEESSGNAYLWLLNNP